jgi:ATP-dependent Lon protease
MKGPILCFVGPPGTGKTSLGQSIARAMGRKFVRVAMGGVRDEAEIRGHRRTYVGALPGRIIQGLKKGGTNNPVFVLDEVDKLAHDFRGDPASALLEVLDPEQNHTFQDHYIDTAFDLSKCFFIATANVLETVPPALRDRMEVLELPGYTHEEKLEIAKRHLVPKALEEHGLDANKLELAEETLMTIIMSYTREAGVRNLKREIDSVCRGIAVEFAEGERDEKRVVEPADLEKILGPEKYFNEMAERTDVSGVATGLAWTAVGGDVLFIEATKFPGKGGMTLTGQLGDVMKESAQAALSYIRAQAGNLGIEDETFKEFDLHVHIPAGAIPKDGPSAGVTMLASLVSLLTGINVRADVAMTGEITLRGKVLPVGGIKEKVLAARRAGVRRIILPERNKKDLVEIPDENKKDLEFIFAQQLGDVLEHALVNTPKPLSPAPPSPKKKRGDESKAGEATSSA